MRRKVEILKYSANKSTTQTNNLTKSQRYALLMRGGLQTPSQLSLSNRGNSDCDSDQTLPTPTTSCGVPGPVIYLQYDAAVPLYNFSNFNVRSYPDYVPDTASPLQFVAKPDVIMDTDTALLIPTPLYYLIIHSGVDQLQRTFNLTAPIGLSFSGVIPPDKISAYLNSTISIKVTSAILNVYCNSILVNTHDKLSSGLPDISFKLVNPIFNARQFFGTLQFNGFSLYTSNNNAYSFSISINTDITSSNANATEFINYTSFSWNLISNPETINSPSGYVVTSTARYNPGASIVQI